jgi:hypothetical protein
LFVAASHPDRRAIQSTPAQHASCGPCDENADDRRDIEERLFGRGVTVSYETIRRWCEKFGAGIAHRVKAAHRRSGNTPTGKFAIQRFINGRSVQLIKQVANDDAATRLFNEARRPALRSEYLKSGSCHKRK